MQRIRMSLPYYKEQGWEAEVITVDEQFVEGYKDELLLETIPESIKVHKVKAWPVKYTRKLGLSSLSIRSYFQFKKKGTALLKEKKYDLIFFSTTMFHVCALGRYWKEKYGVPFIIDLQDPWRNDYYLDKPKSERPPKFWMAYTIHKLMEAYTMPFASGIIAVSKGYIDSIKERYPVLNDLPSIVIPFGCSINDFELVKKKNIQPKYIDISGGQINVVYIGAVTQYFLPILRAFFTSFKSQVTEKEKYHFYFIGTNYAVNADVKMVEQLANDLDLKDIITEYPSRIPYFSAIATLLHADILFVPGSMDADYNASKVYNNILTKKPIFSIFNQRSLVKEVIENCEAGVVVAVDGTETENELTALIDNKMDLFKQMHLKLNAPNLEAFDKFTAKTKTQEQVQFFNLVVSSVGGYNLSQY